jgi:hypothetical protein
MPNPDVQAYVETNTDDVFFVRHGLGWEGGTELSARFCGLSGSLDAPGAGPGAHGPQASELRAIPVFILSSSSEGSDVERADSLGAIGHFSKPGNVQDLSRAR